MIFRIILRVGRRILCSPNCLLIRGIPHSFEWVSLEQYSPGCALEMAVFGPGLVVLTIFTDIVDIFTRRNQQTTAVEVVLGLINGGDIAELDRVIGRE